ncbi:MAG TPA: efflux RND transporter periplasmic adaptor subunit [Wenzhouxiangellaceae bacterium]|nr:efflux RND transporter periplasmic adaptor subunit [Wenzhouxiangellaceae bacterium]
MKLKLFAAAGLAAIAMAAWLFWPKGGQPGGNRIEADPVERGDITRIVSSVGSVRALNTVEVGSQLSGQVIELFADFNTPVESGDLLARIDPQTFERRVQEADANLAVALANVAIQAASIQRAEANLKAARREFERQASLVEKGSVSESALDASEAAYQSALAEVAIARAQHQNANATVAQREAALEAARIDLERTEIRSPINGVVIERAVDIGQTVAASLQAPILFTIAQDLTEIQIEASVDEADIGSVREDAEASFTVDAFTGDEFRGRVAQVRLAPNEEGNVVTYTVVINARNPDRRLLPGMTASIDIVTGRVDDALRVSNAAVRFRPPESMKPDAPDASGGGPGGGRNPGAELAETLTEIGVDETTRETIASDMREAFASMRGMFASGMDREAIRERIQAMSREVLARHLSAGQVDQLEALQRARAETRAAVLYLEGDGKTLQARAVRLGISDDRFTEVVSGDLAEGDRVVTRVSIAEAD